jgi:HK97 gp10 family phage protein
MNMKLEAIAKNSTSALVRGVTKATLRVEGSAKKLAPVDKGVLRSSYTHEVIEDGKKVHGFTGTNLSYAPAVELGTSKQSPQPHLKPAFDVNKSLIIKDIADAEKQNINRVVR